MDLDTSFGLALHTLQIPDRQKKLLALEAKVKAVRLMIKTLEGITRPRARSREERLALREIAKGIKGLRGELKKLNRQVRRQAATLSPVGRNLTTVGGLKFAKRAAGGLMSARTEILAATGEDICALGASTSRSLLDGATKRGRTFFSWHKVGRAIDLCIPFVFQSSDKRGGAHWRRRKKAGKSVPSGGRGFIIVRDGRKFRLYLPARAGATGTVDGSTLRAGAMRYPRTARDKAAVAGLKLIDVTAVFSRHGFDRVPRRPKCDEWWHYQLTHGLKWYAAAREVYGDAQIHNGVVLAVRRSGDVRNASVSKLRYNGFPSSVITTIRGQLGSALKKKTAV